MKNYSFLAFDLGATSGRSIIATFNSDKFEMRELTRFPNIICELQGKYYWNILQLYTYLKEALTECARQGITPDSIGIDTWGVDFVCFGENGTLLGMPRSYRDPYTEGSSEEYFTIIPREEVYKLTGIQIMNINSLFQLYAGVREGFEPFMYAKDILFMPDALSYLLTGKKVCEYTIASTSQILNPQTKKLESSLLKAAGIEPSVFKNIVMPGTVIGTLERRLMEETGIGETKVVAVAGHDTASAVAAVPALDQNFAYLSSGTWSLMGIETQNPIITAESYEMNFTNEGGVDGTTRFLKNICGMWVLEQCRKEWEKEDKCYTYPEIVEMAENAQPFMCFIDPDEACFSNPGCMTQAMFDFCQRSGQIIPENDAQIIRCIFESLAMKYRYVMDMLEKVAPFPIERLHVIGGGSRNNLLNQFTANAIQKHVFAGPSEATAIGNVMIQAMAAGVVSSLQEIREKVCGFTEIKEFVPQDTMLWEEAYQRFKLLIK